MIRGSAGCLWDQPHRNPSSPARSSSSTKTSTTRTGFVLADPVFQAFRKQRGLTAIDPLDEAPHPTLPHIAQESYRKNQNRRCVFTHGVIPGSSHTQALGISSPGIDEALLMGPCNRWRTAMEHFVGLDVSLKLTAICVVDQTGSVIREGMVDSAPETIAEFVTSNAPSVVRIGLEAGPTATWLWTELKQLGLPVICIDARHAKAVLKMQINKSDRNDAAGIARIMQTGWFKEVRVKDLDSHYIKALLASRALLVKIKRDLENQVRGLLKNLGLVIGRAKLNVFAVRAEELIESRPELMAAVRPLLDARNAIEQQVDDLDRKVMRLARNDAQVRRFMTAPGVGPITALCFLATIDDPTRFKRSRSVGAYVGLTTRRYASGETDWTGRISKWGDKMLRSYLYEAANVLLTRVAKWSTLKAWGIRLAKRSGLRKAKVAVARKLAVILHRMWIEGTEFKWSSKEAATQPA